jgi:hypothetical protein
MKTIAGEISMNLSLVWFGVIVAIEIKNPISIKMRVYRHMHCIRLLAVRISRTSTLVLLRLIARIIARMGKTNTS